MATQFDLTGDYAILQGDTFRWVISVVDATGAVVDLTSFGLRGSMRKSYTDAASTVDFTCTKSSQVTSKGEFVVTLTPAQTAGLAKGTYKYDIEMEADTDVVPNNAEVHKLYRGSVQVLPEATK